MSKISRFTSKAVQLAKNAVGERGEVAAPEGGGGFAEYAVVSLHCLRVYLEKSYREALDLLSEMPQILGEVGLDAANLPDHSTLVKWFDRIKTALWRVRWHRSPRTMAASPAISRRGRPSSVTRSPVTSTSEPATPSRRTQFIDILADINSWNYPPVRICHWGR